MSQEKPQKPDKKKKSWGRRAFDTVVITAVLKVFGFLARVLPWRSLQRAADGAAWVIRKTVPSAQRDARKNLKLVFGEEYSEEEYAEMVAEVTRQMARTMAELFKAPYLSREELKRLVELRGVENLDEALAHGRGVIMMTAHYGNWELMGMRVAAEGYAIAGVARDANHRLAARMVNEARQSQGMEVVDRDSVRDMLRALRDNWVVGLLPDQHAADGCIVVDFLGHPASTAFGVATFAQRTGCRVLPAFCTRQKDGSLVAELHPALELIDTGNRAADIRANTQLFNDVIGEQIRRVPEQWLWLHRRWKVTPWILEEDARRRQAEEVTTDAPA